MISEKLSHRELVGWKSVPILAMGKLFGWTLRNLSAYAYPVMLKLRTACPHIRTAAMHDRPPNYLARLWQVTSIAKMTFFAVRGLSPAQHTMEWCTCCASSRSSVGNRDGSRERRRVMVRCISAMATCLSCTCDRAAERNNSYAKGWSRKPSSFTAEGVTGHWRER